MLESCRLCDISMSRNGMFETIKYKNSLKARSGKENKERHTNNLSSNLCGITGIFRSSVGGTTIHLIRPRSGLSLALV